MVVAGSRGAAEITGIVIPAEEKVDFTSGTAKKTDWKELIPSDKLITVKVTVNVTGSGGGNRSDCAEIF